MTVSCNVQSISITVFTSTLLHTRLDQTGKLRSNLTIIPGEAISIVNRDKYYRSYTSGYISKTSVISSRNRNRNEIQS